MPYDDLIDLLGKRLSLEECVDRITFMGAGPEGVKDGVMTFDIFPNRPDLYSVEGIARGLRGYLGLELGLPSYETGPPRSTSLSNGMSRTSGPMRSAGSFEDSNSTTPS